MAGGSSLLELLVVVAVLLVCVAATTFSLAHGLSRQEARGAAQDWQAAAAWAQLGALWQGGRVSAFYGSDGLEIAHDFGLCGSDLGSAAPSVGVSVNIRRWVDGDGASVSFIGPLAAPDGGGSLYFHASRSTYRVIVRPASGLTVRSWAAD
jgi:hypothetical protein